jgi:hypothetical protein
MNDWKELPAGAKLDRLIAERLGFRVTAGVTQDRYGAVPTVFYMAQRHETPRELPHYSTDLNAAFMLVEAIDGFALYVDAFLGGYGTPFEALIPTGDDGNFVGDAATPALAICRAWLAYKDSKSS